MILTIKKTTMITGFEEQTKPLTDQEREVFLPPIIKGLRVKVGKEKAVTNRDIVRGLKANCDIKIGEARVRKMINYIRNNDIIPCLIATSKGYYIAEAKDEMLDYIDSLYGRVEAIEADALSMKRQMLARWPDDPSKPPPHIGSFTFDPSRFGNPLA